MVMAMSYGTGLSLVSVPRPFATRPHSHGNGAWLRRRRFRVGDGAPGGGERSLAGFRSIAWYSARRAAPHLRDWAASAVARSLRAKPMPEPMPRAFAMSHAIVPRQCRVENFLQKFTCSASRCCCNLEVPVSAANERT